MDYFDQGRNYQDRQIADKQMMVSGEHASKSNWKRNLGITGIVVAILLGIIIICFVIYMSITDPETWPDFLQAFFDFIIGMPY